MLGFVCVPCRHTFSDRQTRITQLWYPPSNGSAKRFKKKLRAVRHVKLRQQFVLECPAADIDFAEEEAVQKVSALASARIVNIIERGRRFKRSLYQTTTGSKFELVR